MVMHGPKFKRQEQGKVKRLDGTSYRRPKGSQSKMRECRRGNGPMADVGYGGDAEFKGLHPSGLVDTLIRNVNELEGLDPKTCIVRISSTVGLRKKEIIIKAASEKSLKVIGSKGILRAAENKVSRIKKEKEKVAVEVKK
jgi:large subunit ribosomal protein L32e